MHSLVGRRHANGDVDNADILGFQAMHDDTISRPRLANPCAAGVSAAQILPLRRFNVGLNKFQQRVK